MGATSRSKRTAAPGCRSAGSFGGSLETHIDDNVRGTWRTETFDGTVSQGTFNGTMNMDPEVLTWDCMIRGKGVSGPGAGTLIWCQNVKTEPGPGGLATVTGTILAPHGL